MPLFPISANGSPRWSLPASSAWSAEHRLYVLRSKQEFYVGKLLVSNQPSRGASRAKDLVYVADTLRLFERRLDDLREEVSAILSGLSSSQARRLRISLRDHLEGDGSDALHAAAVICASTGGGRPNDVRKLRPLLRYGISELLGDDWLHLLG